VYLSPAERRRLDRSHRLAIAAAQDAIDDAADRPLPPADRCAVVCGVGLGATATYEAQHAALLDMGLRALSPLSIPLVMPSSAAALLSLRFGFRGPALTVSTACASGATAIGEGAELLRRGAADLVLAGGVDSMLTYNAICGFLKLDVMTRQAARPQLASRPFDCDRDGFLMAEGAGFLVLRRAADAPGRHGYVVGYGSCADAAHLVAPAADGEGAARCMRLALRDGAADVREVNHVNAHGTSTIQGDLSEARALLDVFGATTAPITALKGTTGHMIGGSGAVEAIMTLWTLRNRLAPPVAGLAAVDPDIGVDAVVAQARPLAEGLGLSNSFGFGGANASLLLAGPDADPPPPG
jgi:3-oxoacyl-[acyl-carrier-protein] synthase II